jgi:uncharacterized circularly permuted ATP-grasp superfamily protein
LEIQYSRGGCDGQQNQQQSLNSDGQQSHQYQQNQQQSLNSDGQQFHQYQQNQQQSLNSDGQQFHQYQQKLGLFTINVLIFFSYGM